MSGKVVQIFFRSPRGGSPGPRVCIRRGLASVSSLAIRRMKLTIGSYDLALGGLHAFSCLFDGRSEKMIPLLVDFRIQDLQSGTIEIGANCLQNLIVSRFIDIGRDEPARVGIGLSPGFAQLCRRPEAKQLVASSPCPESQFLVMSKLGFKGSFPLVKRRHQAASPHDG